MDYEQLEQFPQGADGGENPYDCLLAEASDVARGVSCAIQEVAGTTACKGVQLYQLEKFATERNCLISREQLGIYVDRGSENEVYFSRDNYSVFKLNDFRYADDNLDEFFERIRSHNALFADCPYRLIGFSYNLSGSFCAVLHQPFIHSVREATDDEIYRYLTQMGFTAEFDNALYSNGEFDIMDAVPNNVLVDEYGHLYFIDTVISRTKSSNFENFSRLSPRYSK